MDKKSIFSIFGLDDFNLSETLSKTNIKEYVKKNPKINEMFDKLSDEDKDDLVKSLNALTETFDDMFSTKSEKWTVDDFSGMKVSKETYESADGNVVSTKITLESDDQTQAPVSNNNKKKKKTPVVETNTTTEQKPSNENKNEKKECQCTEQCSCGKQDKKENVAEQKEKTLSLRDSLLNDIRKAENEAENKVSAAIANDIIGKLQSKNYTVDLSHEDSAIVVEFTNDKFVLNSAKQIFKIKENIAAQLGDVELTFTNSALPNEYRVFIVVK